jgi:protein SCO1/2
VRLTVLRNVLWVLAGIGIVGYVMIQLSMSGGVEPPTREQGPAFQASFKLTDHRGVTRTEKDFSGRWMLIFFGFTNCPDVCPTTLAEIANIMEGLEDQAQKVQPIFISIDPIRDTPTALAEYVPLFDERIIGLTGTPEQIAQTSTTFPIFFERVEEAGAPDGYTMAHTSRLFLFDRAAKYADSWSFGTSAPEILLDLKERI